MAPMHGEYVWGVTLVEPVPHKLLEVSSGAPKSSAMGPDAVSVALVCLPAMGESSPSSRRVDECRGGCGMDVSAVCRCYVHR